MLYLSQVVSKNVTFHGKSYAKAIDFVIADRGKKPSIDQLVIKKSGRKYFIPAYLVSFQNGRWVINAKSVDRHPFQDKSFFLVEDLLDKQVIDVNGKRLVRVNDVLLKENGEFKVEGIDIGVSGVFRRLGLPNILGLKNITLPWSVIETFDYQTGTVQIKLSENSLNTFHPAEIADILEEAGTKERLGIVESLDAQKAAAAIEETNDETQSAILEQIPTNQLKNIVEKMHLSEIADVIRSINPFTRKRIFSFLEKDTAKKLRKLLVFEDDEAGGLMEVNFRKVEAETTVKDFLMSLEKNDIQPDSVVIIDSNDKLVGTVGIKNLITADPQTPMRATKMHHHAAYQNTPFSALLRRFAGYNIRTLPVIDENNKVLGVINIDAMLAKIQQEEEREDAM